MSNSSALSTSAALQNGTVADAAACTSVCPNTTVIDVQRPMQVDFYAPFFAISNSATVNADLVAVSSLSQARSLCTSSQTVAAQSFSIMYTATFSNTGHGLVQFPLKAAQQFVAAQSETVDTQSAGSLAMRLRSAMGGCMVYDGLLSVRTDNVPSGSVVDNSTVVATPTPAPEPTNTSGSSSEASNSGNSVPIAAIVAPIASVLGALVLVLLGLLWYRRPRKKSLADSATSPRPFAGPPNDIESADDPRSVSDVEVPRMSPIRLPHLAASVPPGNGRLTPIAESASVAGSDDNVPLLSLQKQAAINAHRASNEANGHMVNGWVVPPAQDGSVATPPTALPRSFVARMNRESCIVDGSRLSELLKRSSRGSLVAVPATASGLTVAAATARNQSDSEKENDSGPPTALPPDHPAGPPAIQPATEPDLPVVRAKRLSECTFGSPASPPLSRDHTPPAEPVPQRSTSNASGGSDGSGGSKPSVSTRSPSSHPSHSPTQSFPANMSTLSSLSPTSSLDKLSSQSLEDADSEGLHSDPVNLSGSYERASASLEDPEHEVLSNSVSSQELPPAAVWTSSVAPNPQEAPPFVFVQPAAYTSFGAVQQPLRPGDVPIHFRPHMVRIQNSLKAQRASVLSTTSADSWTSTMEREWTGPSITSGTRNSVDQWRLAMATPPPSFQNAHLAYDVAQRGFGHGGLAMDSEAVVLTGAPVANGTVTEWSPMRPVVAPRPHAARMSFMPQPSRAQPWMLRDRAPSFDESSTMVLSIVPSPVIPGAVPPGKTLVARNADVDQESIEPLRQMNGTGSRPATPESSA